MPQYALLIYHPEGRNPSREEMYAEHQRWQTYTQELVDAGQYKSSQGLKGVDSATTVRVRDGERQVTDGPFAETKELLAGVYLIEAEDLDGAIDVGARMPSAEYGAIEVRPVWG